MKHSLEEVGVSIFAGAITTILSGIALYFCQMLLFNLFATLIILTITFGLIFSFGLFTALCHAIGPNGTCGDLNYWVVQPVWRLTKKLFIKCFKKKEQDNEVSNNDEDKKNKDESKSEILEVEDVDEESL